MLQKVLNLLLHDLKKGHAILYIFVFTKIKNTTPVINADFSSGNFILNLN